MSNTAATPFTPTQTGWLGLTLNTATGFSNDFDFLEQVVGHGFLTANSKVFSLHLANTSALSWIDFGVSKPLTGLSPGTTSVPLKINPTAEKWETNITGVQFGSDTEARWAYEASKV